MGVRILVVEDENGIADFLVRGLREEGFAVERAADGAAAWVALRSGDWDLLLLDWWLPDVDGLEVLRRFRQVNRHTPVLFLTARDTIADRVQGLDGGADDYLCKPFAFEELLARVRALIRRRDGGPGTVVSFGDVKVDLGLRQSVGAHRAAVVTAMAADHPDARRAGRRRSRVG